MSDTAPDLSRHSHRKDLTFRQAEGIDPLPKMLAHGELSRSLRLELWEVFYDFLSTEHLNYSSAFNEIAREVVFPILKVAFKKPKDEAKLLVAQPEKLKKVIKDVILAGHYADCLEVVQVSLRSSRSARFKRALSDIFNHPTSRLLKKRRQWNGFSLRYLDSSPGLFSLVMQRAVLAAGRDCSQRP